MAQQLADLEKEIFGTAWNNELIKQKINNDEFLYWVYEINSEIVGYLAIQKNFKECNNYTLDKGYYFGIFHYMAKCGRAPNSSIRKIGWEQRA